MKNSKKKVLGVSLLSLLACGILFAGTTYAWYSDHVTVGENQLQAGSLKVDLSKYNAQSAKYESFRDNGSLKLITGENSVNWEPGKSAVAAIKIENKGSLGIQYNLVGQIKSQVTGANGVSLADVIDVYVKVGNQVTSLTDFDTVLAEYEANKNDKTMQYWTKVGTLTDLLNPNTPILSGNMLPENSGFTLTSPELAGLENLSESGLELTIVLHMQETAGNEYQSLSISDFEIGLHGEQWTVGQEGIEIL